MLVSWIFAKRLTQSVSLLLSNLACGCRLSCVWRTTEVSYCSRGGCILWRVMSAKTFRFYLDGEFDVHWIFEWWNSISKFIMEGDECQNLWMVNLMYTEYLNGDILYPKFYFSHLNGECVYPNVHWTFGWWNFLWVRDILLVSSPDYHSSGWPGVPSLAACARRRLG